MGQVQSAEEYQVRGGVGEYSNNMNSNNKNFSATTEDVGDCEINSTLDYSPFPDGATGKRIKTSKSPERIDKCPGLAPGLSGADLQRHVRKLSNVSNRNVQLLSIKPRGEKDAYADDLRARRRSSLINLILGAPSRGPRFSDDLCSLNSHVTNFGIEFFPDIYQANTVSSVSSLRFESIEDVTQASRAGAAATVVGQQQQKRRRSSLSNLDPPEAQIVQNYNKDRKAAPDAGKTPHMPPSINLPRSQQQPQPPQRSHRNPSLASTLASIDLVSSFEKHDRSPFSNLNNSKFYRPPLLKAKQTIYESGSQESVCRELREERYKDIKARAAKGRVNQSSRVLRRTGSELSLYSTCSIGSARSNRSNISNPPEKEEQGNDNNHHDPLRETKLIIILQVCLPFILAGFGNMAAGLVLHRVSEWQAFQSLSTFFILLPSFVGLKGNIEMTLASRMSTLSNLNLLETRSQWKRAYESNLILIISQAIGLSTFATFLAVSCEFFIKNADMNLIGVYSLLEMSVLVVLSSALVTSIALVCLSSIVVTLSIWLANLIQVNPDNLSTLTAALYGDVSCVLIYGLVAEWMFALKQQGIFILPLTVVIASLLLWPIFLFIALKFKETKNIAISSLGPMVVSIVVSMGSGAILSLLINRFKLIALYQPVVNGFGANLIAVQASRVSTWLWCSALKKVPGVQAIEGPAKALGSLATFTDPVLVPAETKDDKKFIKMISFSKAMLKVLKTVLWSFCNSSPNAVAARLLLVMLLPAHTVYFFVIWFASSGTVIITWAFFLAYLGLCLLQVFFLLLICEPLMVLLMKRDLDPDVFGISLLMALADLVGTLCLAGAFYLLAIVGDINVV